MACRLRSCPKVVAQARVLIADDHELVRRGMRSLLETEPGIVVADEAANGREAVEKARALRPDVAVLDIGMPGLNGLEATRQILKASPRTEVLIVTVHDSEQVVRDVLQAGARGFVLKSDAGRALVAAVQSLVEHKPFFSSRVSELVLEGFLRGAPASAEGEPRGRLTPREREVLQLVAEGSTSREVGAALGINVKTVETHRTNIMNKLGLHQLADLVRYAIRSGIVEA